MVIVRILDLVGDDGGERREVNTWDMRDWRRGRRRGFCAIPDATIRARTRACAAVRRSLRVACARDRAQKPMHIYQIKEATKMGENKLGKRINQKKK